ncbi:hypothetical protein K2173_020739 [Erythroxylum novogranatense]|uniref:Uncharacterized protein n=1 Tax=Erythroxylum novogranatense TaxID=1862640 RepID=A0AAV8TNS1_9ROSI|nr:hypothetical protein K2173_020739 [Erythroxylum novogranatense]
MEKERETFGGPGIGDCGAPGNPGIFGIGKPGNPGIFGTGKPGNPGIFGKGKPGILGIGKPGNPGIPGTGKPGNSGIFGTGKPGNPGIFGTGKPGNPGIPGIGGIDFFAGGESDEVDNAGKSREIPVFTWKEVNISNNENTARDFLDMISSMEKRLRLCYRFQMSKCKVL